MICNPVCERLPESLYSTDSANPPTG